MLFNKNSPKQSLNKAYLKEKISRSTMDQFKQNFAVFLNHTNANRNDEEHLKSQVAYFLRDTWFKESHHINPIGKNDLVIHTGKSTADPVGVIIEVKSLTNKAEMLTLEKPNTKALHELVLYYLRQRIEENNNEIKYLIATNIDDWFIFDANEFDKKIYRNSAIKKLYEIKKADNKDNPWFYDELKKLLDHNSDTKLEVAHFSIREFEEVLLNSNLKDDNKLIAIYKLLSPVHLLKLPFANDSNSLQPKFYAELLHLIGLAEIKEGGKKLIQRKKAGERNGGSLIENTISQLESHDKLSRIDKPSQYGETSDERLFNVALELVITWINRILFLKLLEAQLASYHKSDKTYRFLNNEKIKDFDDLDKLFFSVLAKQPNERREEVQKLFAKVPYLNSSLFEPTELEHQTLFIYGLEDRVPLPALNATVLKDADGKVFKGSLNTIDYLFAFLDAYDFSSEGAEEIQEDNKTLINASVLGLIFEKINGYKDGSFFTPGFITMYMCRETIRRAVVQKFNEAKGWGCKEYGELYDKIENSKEANNIINSLKICDPAVGSGHFLVSALNEIIAIKSDLRILLDRNGRRLKEYQAEIVNDELVITDDEGQLYEYNPNNKESQRVQETLFHEKQTIIENCLFGVDINPNSVKICRLRLWIELLKNAYYRLEGCVLPSTGILYTDNNPQLETLPNIDINIKTGNSLISRFALDADLKAALKGTKWNITDYKIAVAAYKEVSNKEQKHQIVKLIEAIKSNFSTKFYNNSKENKELNKLRGLQTNLLTTNIDLFGAKKTKKDLDVEAKRLEIAIGKKEHEIEEIKNNKIYVNAFEWRFEFPEVLNDEGDFVGFDVLIGNPPYVRQEEFGDAKAFLKDNYKVFAGTADLLVYFVEKGISVLKDNGHFNFIIANKFMRAGFGKPLRAFINNYQLEEIIDFGDLPVFEEATTYPCIISIKKQSPNKAFTALKMDALHVNDLQAHIQQEGVALWQDALNGDGWNLGSEITELLIKKIKLVGKRVDDYVSGAVYRGLLTGLNEAFVIDDKIRDEIVLSEPTALEIIKPFLIGKDLKQYATFKSTKYLILFQNKQTKTWFGDLSEDEAWNKLTSKYPNLCAYLLPFKEKAKVRTDKGEYWWEIRPCSYYAQFQETKIIYPNICGRPEFVYDESGVYANQKCFIIPTTDKYLLGILNSSVTFFLFRNILPKLRGDFYEPSYVYFKDFPIPIPDAPTKNAIIGLVDMVLNAKKQSPSENTDTLQKEIDNLVYQLYGLTEEEINIVEGITEA